MFTKTREGLLKANEIITSKAYVGEPGVARSLRNYINELRKMSFNGTQDITDWVKNTGKALELTEVADYEALVKVMTFNKNILRAEYDEEWVEYGFLSVEDGGRGVEF